MLAVYLGVYVLQLYVLLFKLLVTKKTAIVDFGIPCISVQCFLLITESLWRKGVLAFQTDGH